MKYVVFTILLLGYLSYNLFDHQPILDEQIVIAQKQLAEISAKHPDADAKRKLYAYTAYTHMSSSLLKEQNRKQRGTSFDNTVPWTTQTYEYVSTAEEIEAYKQKRMKEGRYPSGSLGLSRVDPGDYRGQLPPDEYVLVDVPALTQSCEAQVKMSIGKASNNKTLAWMASTIAVVLTGVAIWYGLFKSRSTAIPDTTAPSQQTRS